MNEVFWCVEHELLPDESMPDEPFVVDFNAFFENDEERQGDFEVDRNGKDSDMLQFFVTTRRSIFDQYKNCYTYTHGRHIN